MPSCRRKLAARVTSVSRRSACRRRASSPPALASHSCAPRATALEQRVARDGDLRGQAPDGLHSLRLSEPVFEPANTRDVFRDDVDRSRRGGERLQPNDETAALPRSSTGSRPSPSCASSALVRAASPDRRRCRARPPRNSTFRSSSTRRQPSSATNDMIRVGDRAALRAPAQRVWCALELPAPSFWLRSSCVWRSGTRSATPRNASAWVQVAIRAPPPLKPRNLELPCVDRLPEPLLGVPRARSCGGLLRDPMAPPPGRSAGCRDRRRRVSSLARSVACSPAICSRRLKRGLQPIERLHGSGHARR